MAMMTMRCFLSGMLALMLLSAPAYARDGFLDSGNTPSSLEFLPEPPAEDSASFQRDKALFLLTRSEAGSDRWRLAATDADFDSFGEAFASSFGVNITKETTPLTYVLIEWAENDLARAALSAKNHYKRVRPFVYFDRRGSTCTPADEERLSTNGSYPSGHTTFGWGVALILAVLSPERQGAILQRGYDFGQSRVICGAHWQSDVDAGRVVGSAVVNQLLNNEEFVALLKNAKQEILILRK
jgi:acid phosphatase (class A)